MKTNIVIIFNKDEFFNVNPFQINFK
jgi:hypothetical protein